jgi:hypothetical protein
MVVDNTICWKCFDDEYLKEIVKKDGEQLECSVCGEERAAFTIEQLGKLIEPIMREHLSQVEDVNWREEQGDPLSFWVQEVLGECFGFEDEIVEAVIAAEDADPQDGDEAFFDDSCNYVETPTSPRAYHSEWNFVIQELKHQRRFFSSSAKALFDKLFDGVEEIQSYDREAGKHGSVVWELPKGSKLFRARICNSNSLLKNILTDPLRHVGPPPAAKLRAGRMNADGVAVFYGAMDQDTCLAEMRPSLGGDSVVITLQTTKTLRLLDFTRLENSYGGKPLSYFQSDFTEQTERHGFLRRLHKLISQPVIPGRESDYLITQTMAEYLSHVHEKPFDGILFASVQRANGINVVLFSDRALMRESDANAFPLEYINESVKLFSTEAVEYKHNEKCVYLSDGKVFANYDPDDFSDDM